MRRPSSRVLLSAWSLLLAAFTVLGGDGEALASSTADEPPAELVELGRPEVDHTKMDWALVPFVAGSTDTGVAFGAIFVLADLDDTYDPYAFRFRARVVVSVLDGPDGVDFPEHNDAIQLDVPPALGGRLRLTAEVSFQRWSTMGYFGIGNASRIETDAEIKAAESRDGGEAGRRNQHIRIETWGRLNARYELGEVFALMAGFQLRYVIPTFYGGSLLADEAKASRDLVPGATRLHGVTPHWIGQLALGLIMDTRDNELSPRSGMLHELSVRASPGSMTGSRMTFAGLTLNARFYASIIDDDWLVFAARAFVDLLFGTVPYHEMASGGAFERMHMPGGREGIRGVPVGRYHGRVKLIGNLELRSMFASFCVGDQEFRLGAVAFFDAGRIWADFQRDPERDGTGHGMKFGIGGGPRIQWGETVLLRLDVSWSPDAAALDPSTPVGIYAGLAHSF